ncbi:MAG: 3-beta hydroxysteroid dehydrogenase [Pyrinomonadaceae bacterium]|jgi:thioester reductase-like protein|nr:MAG: 3-beta hydroxysteroid dehydrogenase [Pyrinomonadaceae bacterium]
MASKTIFLTGFPGFIAERLLRNLARSGDRFFLLVQKQFLQKASESVEKISQQYSIPAENFQIIEGDITQENLGIQREKLEEIKQETTDVFHLAAIYDLEVKREPAYRVNVEGTCNVNEFVKSLPNLNRYNYVSTCYVAGKRKGIILETELEHNAGFRNFYEETKYLAEIEVEKLKPNLPVTIFRPSVVVGDSKTGETAKYDGIYYLIHYYRMFPSLLRIFNVGNDEVKLNIVPVDFVVDGIEKLSKDESAIGKTVALADPNPLTTREICDVIVEAITNKKTVVTPPASLVRWTLNLPFSPAVTGLPHAGVPYFFISQTYDTSIASSLLAKHGISCPRFADYAKNLIAFVEKNPKL